MRIEEDRELGSYGYWKISFTLFASGETWRNLEQAFFTKWAEKQVGYFPYKMSSGRNSIKISFSDKQTKYKQTWNSDKQKHEMIKPEMTQRDIDDYREWFFELYTRITKTKIKQ